MTIELTDIEFSYPQSNFALAVRELNIPQGQKVAFVGPSGSGKTTLLNLLAGILVPQAGQVRMGDCPVSELEDRKRRNFRISKIGLVFQRFELIDHLRVRDNILLPYYINRSLELTGEVQQRVDRIAAAMELTDKLERWPHRLSQGEQQRVAIGRALLTQPQWVLADEPTGSLDPTNKRRTIELLFEQSARRQSTLIVVTHDTGILEGFDQVIDFAHFHSSTGDTYDQRRGEAEPLSETEG